MLVSIWNADKSLKITGAFSLSSLINITSSFILGVKILCIKLYTSYKWRTHWWGPGKAAKKNMLFLLVIHQRVHRYIEQLHICLEEKAKSSMKLLFSWEFNLRLIHFSIPSRTFFILMVIRVEWWLEKKEKNLKRHYEKVFLIYTRSWCGHDVGCAHFEIQRWYKYQNFSWSTNSCLLWMASFT